MNFIETAVRWRHGTFVLFCLLAMFGLIALFKLPLELQPGGDRPEITISTPYIGAAPAEVEDLITRPLEDVLEEVEGVQEITSQSLSGFSTITMEFDWGIDVDARLVDVLNKLQQLEELPEEAGESDVQVASGNNNPMMWIVLKPKPGYQADSNRYRDLIEEVIEPALRRVEGTSRFFIVGGQEREVEILVDPKALSDRNLTLTDVTNTLSTNNRDIRGGPLVLGKREYQVPTVNRAQELDQLKTFVLRRDNIWLVQRRSPTASHSRSRTTGRSGFVVLKFPSLHLRIQEVCLIPQRHKCPAADKSSLQMWQLCARQLDPV